MRNESTLLLEDRRLILSMDQKKYTLLELKPLLLVYLSILEEQATPDVPVLADAYCNFSDRLSTKEPSMVINIGEQEYQVQAKTIKPRQATISPSLPFETEHICLFPFFTGTDEYPNECPCLLFQGSSEEIPHRFYEIQDNIRSRPTFHTMLRTGIYLSLEHESGLATLKDLSFLYKQHALSYK